MFASRQRQRHRKTGGGGGGGGGRKRLSPPSPHAARAKAKRGGGPGGGGGGVNGARPRGPRGRLRLDDEDEHSSSSSSSEDEEDRRGDRDEEGGDEEMESADAKRVRLAREYLRRVEERPPSSSSSESDGGSGEEEGSDDEDDDGGRHGHDAVARRLARSRLRKLGSHDETGLADKIRKRLDSLRLRFHPAAGSGACVVEEDAEVESRGWLRRYPCNPHGPVRYVRGHSATPTCVALGGSSAAYSGSKDGSVLAYDVETERSVGAVLPRWDLCGRRSSSSSSNNHHSHEGEVLALAVSDDGRYLASGGRDCVVRIFDVRTGGVTKSGADEVAKFRGHRGAVTCLAFRSNSLQLFSGSEDRCIRHYNLEEMAYVETLYGHQAAVTCVDCHRAERPVSVARDRTVRAWKVAEESHLIYRGGSRAVSADCVAAVGGAGDDRDGHGGGGDGWFVTGHEDGALNLWRTERKRAVATVEAAHHRRRRLGTVSASSSSSTTCMIASCDALKGSDLVATGSNDGYLRFWRARTGRTDDDRGLDAVGKVPVHGYVNGIAIGPGARFCALAVGREHRLGRWEQVPRAKDRFAILRLRNGDDGGGPLDAADASRGAEDEGKAGIDGVGFSVKDDTKSRVNGVSQRMDRGDSSGDDSRSKGGTEKTGSSSSDDESSDSGE